MRQGPALLPKFLEFVLNSDWTQKHIDEYSVGTIQSHFNVGAMQEVPVPVPPVPDQAAIVTHLQRMSDAFASLVAKLSEQIGLLQEHRQAVIKAAVTGELDIRGVAA